MDLAEDPHWPGLQIVARGANRLCAIDPGDPAHCLKFELPGAERTAVGLRPRLRRALARAWPRFGENRTELRAWRRLRRRLGDDAGRHFAACEGIVDTRWGRALRCLCVRLPDGRPARSLYAHLFSGTAGWSADELCAAVDDFERLLLERGIALFDLNAGNFVVVADGAAARLVCVDAKSMLDGKELLPLSRHLPPLRRRKIARRAERLRQRIRDALAASALAPPSSAH